MIISSSMDIKVTTLPHTKEHFYRIPLAQYIPATNCHKTLEPGVIPMLLLSSLCP